MQAQPSRSRPATTLAVALGLILFGACNKQKKDASPTPLTPDPPSNPLSQHQTPNPLSQHQMLAPTPLPKPVVRVKAYELFDMGKDGEDKYKGKVVHISGLVDVNATKRPGPGGTSTLIVKAKPGEPPYAIATFGPDSEQLLFIGRYNPPSVSLQGIYRSRDEHGTVLLDQAKVTSLTQHFPWFDFRQEDPRKPNKTPPQKKSPVSISAQQLAQEFQDDLNATYRRYYGNPLQIDGVITKQTQTGGAVTRIEFMPLVTDKKTNKPVELVLFCFLRRQVPIGSPEAADLAVGKRVTLIGNLSAAGNGQATFGSCVVQKQSEKK